MAQAPPASILYRLSRLRRAPVEPDPAEFGTAFGLDMSFDRARQVEANEAPKKPGWLERLGLRAPR